MPLNCKIVSKSDAVTVGQNAKCGGNAERVRAVAFLLARINLKMYTKGSV